jgi:hypothetical protein
MLRVAAKNPHCQDAYVCPTVIEDTDMPDDAYVQGYDDIPAHVLNEAAPPAGERLIRVPRALLIEAAHKFERQQLFANAHTLFRLETLPQYLTPQEDERFRAFLQGRPVAPRTPDTSPWLKQISEGTAAGQIWHRVHITDWPLSAYLRFELTTDVENVAAGEKVLVADRGMHPWMKGLTEDFWLLDGDDPDRAAVLLLRYDPQGRFTGAETSTDRDVIRRCRRRRDLVLPRAIPVADYLDQIGLEPARVG